MYYSQMAARYSQVARLPCMCSRVCDQLSARVALKMAPLPAPLLLVVLLGTLVPCHGHKFVHPLSLISFHKATVKLSECAALKLCQTSIQPAFLQRNSTCMSLCYSCACSCASADDSITVTASPDLLAVSGSWVTVTYKGVEKPSKDDLVAVYSPTPDRPSLDPRKSAPVKYIVSVGRSSSSCLCTC